MKRLFILYSLIFSIVFSASSQEEINNYKYIIIPTTFKFLKEADQYQANSLAKFLFNKYGYTAFMANEELPSDLEANPCLGLTADVEDVKGGFLVTKLQFNLRDCRDKIVASSKVGKSKQKEFKEAYHEAIREAFETFQYFEYEYLASNAVASSKSTTMNVNVNPVVTPQTVTDSNVKKEQLEMEVPEQKGIQQAEAGKVAIENGAVEAVPSGEWLYAQPIENGFQVVDMEPKKVMILINSGKPDTYIVKGQNAIVYKDGNDWIYASTEANGPKQKKIKLKF